MEFNINEYIWYIVGGVALLFIFIGFLADKSGLAKKTFEKDTSHSNKSKKMQNETLKSDTDTVAPEPIEEQNAIQPPVAIEEVPTPEIEPKSTEWGDDSGDSSGFDPNINEDDFLLNTEAAKAEEEVVQEPVNLASDTSEFEMNNTFEDNNLGGNESWELQSKDLDENINKENVDEINNDESISVASESDVQENENASDNQDTVSQNSEEDVWGMSNDAEEKSEDVTLPDLEQVDAAEEDVWKF